MFFVLDSLNYRRAPKAVREKETAQEEWRYDGLKNVIFLLVILVAVFLVTSSKMKSGAATVVDEDIAAGQEA